MKNSWLLIIYLNDEIAGFLYGLKWKNEILVLQNCVNTKYDFYSSTFRGIYDYINHLISNNNIRTIDFTRGTESYKYKLNGQEKELHNYIWK